MILRGRVVSGMGNFSYWIEKLHDLYARKTGMDLFPGTLNVRLDEPYSLPERVLRLEGSEYGGTVSVNLVPCLIQGRRGFLLRTDANEQEQGHHPKTIVEVATDVKLRDHFSLKDGDTIEVQPLDITVGDQLRAHGYAIVTNVLDDCAIAQYIKVLGRDTRHGSRRGGRRNLLAIAEIRALANSKTLLELVCPVLGDNAFPVRGILFDKSDAANWKVPWHQDVTITVKNRVDTDGYGPWSVKDNILHVQPPSAVLEGMVSVRLHIDDCLATNGALRVIAGSHHRGRVNQNSIADLVNNELEVMCEVKKGGALLMSPLTIHASSAAETPHHRRVIHIDYANVVLANGLQWYEQS